VFKKKTGNTAIAESDYKDDNIEDGSDLFISFQENNV